ncbi:MAG: AAA family ATPase, partial [Bacteroidales bacterium]|nr:AAA family ATPase [Bacteroidales bacterium]
MDSEQVKQFVDGGKTRIIAPAGYGKTYSIAECIEYTQNNNLGKQLILTHTHAGIASIKEKLAKKSIKSSSYKVETISSYAQKYVCSFYIGNDMPEQKDSNPYHQFLIKQATELFRLKSVQTIIKTTYNGLFVDEYQDCTQSQHTMIMCLADILPTHILGDPLQGIFGFQEKLVDFDADLNDFTKLAALDIPQRWRNNGNNFQLGESLGDIRNSLKTNSPVDLSQHRSTITLIKIDDVLSVQNNTYKQQIRDYFNRDSLLILLPEYKEKGFIKGKETEVWISGISYREKIKSWIDYENSFNLIEAIDEKTLYSLASNLDDIFRARNKYKKLITCLKNIFNSTAIDNWFNDYGVKKKQNTFDMLKSKKLAILITDFMATPSYWLIYNILKEIKMNLKLLCHRKELFRAVLRSLETVMTGIDGITIKDAMYKYRNTIRHVGRKIYGKCIGTTLLTKGLEFDTVVILDAHKFPDEKNFYVAVT